MDIECSNRLCVRSLYEECFYLEPVEEDCMWKYESVNFSKGYRQTIHLPKWSLHPQVFSHDFQPSYGEIDVSVPDHDEEHSVTISCISTKDRRNLDNIITHHDILKLAHAAFLFAEDESAQDHDFVIMYYTENPLQMYYGKSFDNQFKVMDDREPEELYKFSEDEAKVSLLNAATRLVLRKLVNYISKKDKRKTPLSRRCDLDGTVREEGFALIRRLYMCQEVRLPVSVPSLRRISLVTVVTNIHHSEKVNHLASMLPTAVYSEIADMYETIK